MLKSDADLFLDWAADEFIAAGRAPASDECRQHRLQGELFCDIFHALNEARPCPAAADHAVINAMLVRAYRAQAKARQG